MKATLINPYDFSGPGIRSIASVLRADGNQVQSIFLLLDGRFLVHSTEGIVCNRKVLDEILNNCRDSDVVGITLMSNAFNLAVSITQHIKKALKIPVIWGGIHPTISPEECLNYTDIVCIGEGEAPMLNLVSRLQKRMPYLDVEGFWFNCDGKIIKNRIPALIQDLDTLPRDEYENSDDRVLKKQEIISVNHKVAEELLGTQLTVYASRGCPYRCSFCCNNVLNNLYKNQRIVRYRSPAVIVRDVEKVVSRFKGIKRIFFDDDSFIVRPLEEIKEFSRLYKKYINLPFSCQITAPSVTEEKIKSLVEAGLNDVRVGVQSATPRILKLYNRPISAEAVRKASQTINKYLGNCQLLSYDIILDNPYETREDLITTLKFLVALPRPFSLRFYSLQLYPGTQLYQKAHNEKDSIQKFRNAYYESYRLVEGTYLNFLFYLMKFIGLKRCPSILGRFLLRKEMLFLLDRPWANAIIRGLRNLRTVWMYSIKLKMRSSNCQVSPIIKEGYTNI